MLAKGHLLRADKYPINIEQRKKKFTAYVKRNELFRIVDLYYQYY